VEEGLDRHTHFLYEESIRGKGADEVASMLIFYLKQLKSRETEKLILWADNCGGQNKNKTIIQMIAYIVATGMFKFVELKSQFRDILCPKPSDDVFEEAAEVKKQRVKNSISRRNIGNKTTSK
jgi:hypothetical protein